MDTTQDSTLMDHLADLPDPRKRRGTRHAWRVVLTVISAALAAGCRTPHAIGQSVGLHATVLHASLCPTAKRVPSESTVVRALRHVNVAAVESRIAEFGQHAETPASAGTISCPNRERLDAQAIDGKALRGATTHGQTTHLISLVRHGSGTTLAQLVVARKRNEIAAVPLLLAGHDLTDSVTTMDALLTQRAIARTILAQGGHYLMVVKRNQRRLYEDLELFFGLPPIVADGEAWDRVQTISKGHGRIERRTLESSSGLCAYLSWPGVAQVVRRRCERTIVATGEYSCEVSYLPDRPRARTSRRDTAGMFVARALDDRELRSLRARCDTRGRCWASAYRKHCSRAGGVAQWHSDRLAASGLAQYGGCRAGICCIGP
jgi:hypothetical protein